MNKKVLIFAIYALVLSFTGFILDQLIIYFTIYEKFFPTIPVVQTFFSGIIPGLFLGIALALGVKHVGKKIEKKQFYTFILIAALGTLFDYVLQDLFFIYNILPSLSSRFIANLISSYSLIIAFHIFIIRLTKLQIFSLGLVGALLIFLPFIILLPISPFLFLLSFIYPICIGIALGWITIHSRQENKIKHTHTSKK